MGFGTELLDADERNVVHEDLRQPRAPVRLVDALGELEDRRAPAWPI